MCHPIFTFLPPCLDFFDSSATIRFFFIRVCAVAPGGPVKEQSIEFFFGLPSRGFDVHSVSKHGAGSEVPQGLGARGGGRRFEGRRGLHLRKASRGLQGSLKRGFKGLERGLKGASPSEGSNGFEGVFKWASRGLEGGLKPSEGEGGFEGLEGSLKGASRGVEGGFNAA